LQVFLESGSKGSDPFDPLSIILTLTETPKNAIIIHIILGEKVMKINVLISEKLLKDRIKELAKQIEKDYKDKEITIVSVLRGGVFFTVDLSKQIESKINFEFIEVSSYGNSFESTGNIKIQKEISISIEGKDVLIVEDIIDSGRTLKYLKQYLENKKAKSVKIATLLNKPERREVEVDVDYIGFDIPNKFVLGYGLDYEGYYRNLPYIGYIEE